MESPYPNESYEPIIDVHNNLDPETDILKLDDNFEETDADLTFENEKTDPAKDINNSAEQEEDEPEAEAELSPGGILDEETIARGLSNIGRSATGEHIVCLNVAIPGFSLTDISLLGEHIHLQKVEIPHNDISDLSCLGMLKHLVILDASHNNITKLLDFEPPKFLQEVDLSWNKITEMSDLSAHKSLRKLILDNNEIPAITGLKSCSRLKHLSLAHNNIKIIEGLEDLPIQHLNLSNNGIRMIENLQSLKKLREVNLSGNQIRSLAGLDSNPMLTSIDLEGNEVIDMVEIQHICGAKYLRDLNLLRNPIQELPDYRLSILFRLAKITSLDRRLAKAEEKVAAVNMFDPPMEVVAARDHIMHVVYHFLQPSRVWDSTLPNIETPYPMLVLVGPQGSGKKDLAMKLVDEFGDYFGYGTSHTTRRPRPDEVNAKDYHFVSLEKFEMEIKMGQFIQTYQYNENWYGMQMDAVESVAREGLACVVHMELEGVLTLKNTHLEPRYVLILPLNTEDHERRLRERGIYTEEQIARTLKRAEMYVKHNQEHPGFFDMMICSDDISEAYRQIRRLVMDYLGVSATTPASTAAPYTITDTREPTEAFPMPFATVPGVGGVSGVGRPGSTNQGMGARTWSKPSIPDSMSQRGNTRVGSGAPVSRGIVEEESIKRRHSAAKDVVSGYVPPLYEQLLTSYPKTAQSNEQQGLGDDTTSNNIAGAEHRTSSAAQMGEKDQTNATSASCRRNGNPLYHTPRGAAGAGLGGAGPTNNNNRPGSADSSSSDDSSSTNLSDLDSATELQHGINKGKRKAGGGGASNSGGNNAGGTGQAGTGSRGLLPTEKVNPLELISEQGYSSAKSHSRGGVGAPGAQDTGQLQDPRPPSGGGVLRPDSATSRPGSERHAVLPPIKNVS